MARAPDDSEEHRLIARHFGPIARHPGALGLTDDAAVLTVPAGHDLILTADALVGGVHFFPDDPPDAIARKALRVNLSDLAAKGAEPTGFLLTLALVHATPDEWVAAFASGLGADAETYRCPLLGGDTVATPGPVTISITALGAVPQGRMIRRAGARAGDHVFVTGTIGDAALGLRLRRGAGAPARWALGAQERDHLLSRYLLPRPRNALAGVLRDHASAAMDVSDGLAGDLGKLCGASGVSADIVVAGVPMSVAARAALAAEPGLIEPILGGGDDYEILATVPASRAASFAAAATAVGVPVHDIGRVVAGEGTPRFLDGDGVPVALARRAFSHF